MLWQIIARKFGGVFQWGDICATTMLSDKYIFGNLMEMKIHGDYRTINIKLKSDHYLMPTIEELFYVIWNARVFNTLDLRSDYHQLFFWLHDWVKTSFCGIDCNGNDQLYHWKVFSRYQKCTNQFFASDGPSASKMIFFSMLSSLGIHHKSMWGNCKQFLSGYVCGVYVYAMECKFFHERLSYLWHMIVPWGIWCTTSKGGRFAKYPNT